jgi:DNA-binding NtrC family response regulator
MTEDSRERLRRILLLDDHPLVAEMLETCLVEEGFSVRPAASHFEAVTLVRAGAVDVIVTDGLFSDAAGADLKSEADQCGVPLIVISGDPQRMDEYRSRNVAFLAKPFRMSKLIDLILERTERPPGQPR